MEKDKLPTEPYHILLADDDESDRLLFLEAFEELNVKTRIHTVNNGIDLMAYLSLNSGALPDFLFLDLNMPRKNGIECLQEIRSNRKFDAMVIAIYSTSATDSDMEETFINDANVYIIKPNEFPLLKQALSKAITTPFQYQDPPFDKSKFLL